MSESAAPPPEQPFAPRAYLATMPRWKLALVAGSAVVMVVAALAMAFEDPVPAGGAGAAASDPSAAPGATRPATLVAGQGPTESAGGPPTPMPWSEAIFRFGFSFFIGFAIGFATRAFLRFVLFLIGGLAVFLFVMSYYGFVTVEWAALDQAFENFGAALRGQFGAFRSFITGSLPNAGLAGLGLFAGFKKNP